MHYITFIQGILILVNIKKWIHIHKGNMLGQGKVEYSYL